MLTFCRFVFVRHCSLWTRLRIGSLRTRRSCLLAILMLIARRNRRSIFWVSLSNLRGSPTPRLLDYVRHMRLSIQSKQDRRLTSSFLLTHLDRLLLNRFRRTEMVSVRAIIVRLKPFLNGDVGGFFDGSLFGFLSVGKDIEQRGFSAAVGTDESDFVSCPKLKGGIEQHWFRRKVSA